MEKEPSQGQDTEQIHADTVAWFITPRSHLFTLKIQLTLL